MIGIAGFIKKREDGMYDIFKADPWVTPIWFPDKVGALNQIKEQIAIDQEKPWSTLTAQELCDAILANCCDMSMEGRTYKLFDEIRVCRYNKYACDWWASLDDTEFRVVDKQKFTNELMVS
jgi:hypothetical protein